MPSEERAPWTPHPSSQYQQLGVRRIIWKVVVLGIKIRGFYMRTKLRTETGEMEIK